MIIIQRFIRDVLPFPLSTKQERADIRNLKRCGFIETSFDMIPNFSVWNHPVLKRPVMMQEAKRVMHRLF